MVSYTSTLIDARAERVDRYRRPASLSPVLGFAKGDLCPLAVAGPLAGPMAKPMSTKSMSTSRISWQPTTTHNSIVVDDFGFDQVTDHTRLGPPPPRRPSV